MKKCLKKLDHLIRDTIRWISAMLIFLMVIAVIFQVISRYVFNSGYSWPEELTRFCCVWLTFMGALLATILDNHPAVDVLQKALPNVLQTLVFVLIKCVMLGVCLLLCWYGFRLAKMTITDLSPGLRFPMGLVYLSLPLSMAVMTPYLMAQILKKVWGEFYKKREGKIWGLS